MIMDFETVKSDRIFWLLFMRFCTLNATYIALKIDFAQLNEKTLS